jgi:hypothetical protein
MSRSQTQSAGKNPHRIQKARPKTSHNLGAWPAVAHNYLSEKLRSREVRGKCGIAGRAQCPGRSIHAANAMQQQPICILNQRQIAGLQFRNSSRSDHDRIAIA